MDRIARADNLDLNLCTLRYLRVPWVKIFNRKDRQGFLTVREASPCPVFQRTLLLEELRTEALNGKPRNVCLAG